MRHRKIALALSLIAITALFWPALSFLVASRSTERHGTVVHPHTQNAKPWVTYRGADDGTQYSDLSEITPENVTRLQLVWTHHSGDIGSIGDGTAGAYEATPIFVNALLYFCNPKGRVFALDPKNGTQRWSVDVHALAGLPGKQEICRGVTYWQDEQSQPAPCTKRIFFGDVYGRLYALDADTGSLCTQFGGQGFIDLNSFA